jgi:hypothetical protein
MEPMDEKQEEHFKKLMREAGTEQPSGTFARAVMQRVHEEITFRAVVQRNAIEVPSDAFSKDIIAQLKANQPVASPKPVIARKIWYGIAAAWAMLILACFFIPNGDQQTALLSSINGLVASNQVFTQKISSVPQTFMLTIIGLSALLLVDYYLRQKWVLNNKTARY